MPHYSYSRRINADSVLCGKFPYLVPVLECSECSMLPRTLTLFTRLLAATCVIMFRKISIQYFEIAKLRMYCARTHCAVCQL